MTQDPQPQTQTPAPGPRAARPWLAPTIALGLALLFLLVLMIPGVLRYRGAPDETALAALRDSNAALEQEITRLSQADPAQICMYDGDLFPRSVEQSPTPPAPSQRLDLLPPMPSRAAPAPEALPQSPVGSEDQAAGNVDELLRRGTVLVLAQTPGGFGNGSGFFVDPRHIVTNAHVVGDAQQVIVTNETIRAPLRAAVVARTGDDGSGAMPQEDFAILRLEEDVASAMPMTLGPARRMQAVYASGYPGFYLENQIRDYFAAIQQGQQAVPPEAVVTDGMVTTIQTAQRANGPLGYIPHTAKISPGNSGGPLVDSCGRVVGINTFVTQSDEGNLLLHGDYALTTDALGRFLQANGVSARMATGDCAPSRVASAAPQPETGEAPE